MSRRAQQSTGGLLDRIPIGRGGRFGVIAYVLGYAATYVFYEFESDESLGDLTDSVFELVGVVFYNAHFVDTELSGGGESETRNFLSEASELTVPEPVWYLVPVAVLVIAGYVVTQRGDGRALSTQDAVASGASIVAGYLPLAVAGTFLFSFDQSFFGTTVSFSPDTVPAVALAGLAFPLICGGVGGFLTTVVGGSGASQSRGGRGRGRQRRQGQQQGRQRQGNQQPGQGGRPGGGQGGQRGGQQQGGQRGNDP